MLSPRTPFAVALNREGISAAEVARALGVTRQSVGEWARGRRPIPSDRYGQIATEFPLLAADLEFSWRTDKGFMSHV